MNTETHKSPLLVCQSEPRSPETRAWGEGICAKMLLGYAVSWDRSGDEAEWARVGEGLAGGVAEIWLFVLIGYIIQEAVQMVVSQNILHGEERKESMPAHIPYWPKAEVLNPCASFGCCNTLCGCASTGQCPAWSWGCVSWMGHGCHHAVLGGGGLVSRMWLESASGGGAAPCGHNPPAGKMERIWGDANRTHAAGTFFLSLVFPSLWITVSTPFMAACCGMLAKLCVSQWNHVRACVWNLIYVCG